MTRIGRLKEAARKKWHRQFCRIDVVPSILSYYCDYCHALVN